MPYFLDGKEFSSIKKLSEYTGVNEKTITKRLKRGLTVDEACKQSDLRCNYNINIDGENKSLSDICREKKRDYAFISNRLSYGYDISEALSAPKKVTKQGITTVVNGIEFKSRAEAIRAFNLEKYEQRICRKINAGNEINEVFREFIIKDTKEN